MANKQISGGVTRRVPTLLCAAALLALAVLMLLSPLFRTVLSRKFWQFVAPTPEASDKRDTGSI